MTDVCHVSILQFGGTVEIVTFFFRFFLTLLDFGGDYCVVNKLINLFYLKPNLYSVGVLTFTCTVF